MSCLETAGLSYEYPGVVRAVDGVDLSVEAGELVALLGPNGSGKSTLLKLCAGLYPPLAGRVTFAGRDLAELDARARARHIALVPQSLRALPDVSVRDFVLGGRYGHLGFWRQESAHDLQMVELALAATELAPLAERLLTQLSGGQRQRVLVARALAQEALLLLVDEPTNSLDPEHQVQVFRMLAGLARNGRAVLVVTHDLNLASQFATRLAVMKDGALVAAGSAGEVLRREVLAPIYGDNLRYGVFEGEEARPFVLPWRPAEP
ncbi:MAG: ABC transporter ATP-binding protein [Planctomycetes bacterium]|nr:ABC transporter ATP-binding protein [Planctomycetota bacterium]